MGTPHLNTFDLPQSIRDAILRDAGGAEFLSALQDRYTLADNSMSEEAKARLRAEVDRYNATPGTLSGFDCKECLNRGGIAYLDGDGMRVRECKCLGVRRSIELMRKSGLANMLERQTLASFEHNEPWQMAMWDTAGKFLRGGGWLFVGGQSGCGKTHLCTGVCGEILKRGRSVKYVLWQEESQRLRSKVNDVSFHEELEEYRDVDVLYIDDFLKTQGGSSERREQPSAADVRMALLLLNPRYNDRKATILSTEWHLREIIEMDEALGGRIYQMSKNSRVDVARSKEKNWRYRVE